MFKCTFCIFQSRHFLCWLNHYDYKHSTEPGFKITCPHPVCGKSFKNVRSCQRHLRVFHSKLYSELLSQKIIPTDDNTPALAFLEQDIDVSSNSKSELSLQQNTFKLRTGHI